MMKDPANSFSDGNSSDGNIRHKGGFIEVHGQQAWARTTSTPGLGGYPREETLRLHMER